MLEKLLERSEDLKTFALFAMALGFEIAERLRPYQRLDRRNAVKLDVLAFVVLGLTLTAAGKVLVPAFGLLEREAFMPVLDALRTLPTPVKVPVGLVIVDVVLYWIHRSMHRFDILWRTHEWHHSSDQLYWFSGFRTSVLHASIYAVPQLGIGWLLKVTPLEGVIGGLIGIFSQLWTHANVPVNLGPLGWLLVSPGYHRAHHAISENRFVNLSNMFTIWDRMFGTYVDPASLGEGFATGLGYRKSVARMIVGV